MLESKISDIKNIKAVILYLLKNTEEYRNQYYVPNNIQMKKIKKMYSNAPEDYLDFLKEFGHIGGPLDIYGVSKGNDNKDFYLRSEKISEENQKNWNLKNIIVVREDGMGNFDFIDLNKSTKEKAYICRFYHEDGYVRHLEHKSFFTYCLKYMLWFLEDEFDENDRYDEFEELEELSKEFDRE